MLKKLHLLFISSALVLTACANQQSAPPLADVEQIETNMKRVANWQINNWTQRVDWNKGGKLTKQHGVANWTNATLYVGMLELAEVSGDERYQQWVVERGEQANWTRDTTYDKYPGRIYHADDYAVGQAYFDLYLQSGDKKMFEPIKNHLDWIMANRKTGSLEWKKGTDRLTRWGWSDALFMAPPVFARLAAITNEQKYLDFMHEEYMATYNYLWDTEESLFFRDSSFFDAREKNGEKVFWSRGNGWVFGGLAIMLQDLPDTWQHKAFYQDLFKQMAKRLKGLQKPDGSWPMGLLGGVEGYPNKEVSGTGFFTYGLAWGINSGLLEKDEYINTVKRGWYALETSIQPNGMLGYVQPVGAAPGDSGPNKTEVYGVGAFLSAGAEVIRLQKAQ
ncbi:glycoside hydrolase family 88/105 protein [Thalassotalea marina]|uniref:Glycoside hydrolase family 88 protein n=1 Tax=Thalassotalea marina TaxID=1673741 RepID=A0A919EM58_9GAMM|nr:glycoside hydrolase family 88 protein [Thalassotalea marina]GHF97217.1 hypothetical protein GCM10017161_26700 [Thalassotalea marina]